jgi:beta-N-acetylhexosaminidase
MRRRTPVWLAWIVFFTYMLSSPVSAITPALLQQLQYGTQWYHPGGSTKCGVANAGDTVTTGVVTIPANWTSRDKIAQLLIVGSSDVASASHLLKDMHVGGIIVGVGGAKGLLDKAALAQVKAAAPIVPIIAIDQEGGAQSRLTLVDPSYAPPTAEAMGSMTTDQVTTIAKDAGSRIAALGINVDFAPVADVIGTDGAVQYPLKARSFGSDKANVTLKAQAFATGILASGILPVFKHFPGHGKAVGATAGANSDKQPVTTPPLADLRKDDLVPYESLLKLNPAGVMMGNLTVPGLAPADLPTSLNPAAVDLLRKDYGYSGIVFTDDLLDAKSITQYHPDIADAVSLAIKAGVDAPLMGAIGDDKIAAILDKVEAMVASGSITQVQLDTALGHVLAFKSHLLGTAGGGAANTSTTGADGLVGFPAEWVPIVNKAAGRFEIDPAILVGLLKVETGWAAPSSFATNPQRNEATATGPFQIVDSTAEAYESTPDKWVDTLYLGQAGTGDNGKGIKNAPFTSSTVKSINNGTDKDPDGSLAADGNKDGTADRAQPEDGALMAAAYIRSGGGSSSTPLGDTGDYGVSANNASGKITVRTLAAHYNQGGNFGTPEGISLADINALTYAKNRNKVGDYMDGVMQATAAARASGLFPSSGTPGVGTSGTTGCTKDQCVGTPNGPSGQTAAGTIVLDPGHITKAPSGRIIDPATGVDVTEDVRDHETQNVWDVAQGAKTKLTALGYTVILTRQNYDDNDPSLKSRSEVANTANAALAISIHTTPSENTDSGNTVNYQKVGTGLHKGAIVSSDNPPRWSEGSPTDFDYFFDNTDLQTKSLSAANNLVTAMKSSGISQSAHVAEHAFSQRGNIWVVQFFSKVPWIYAEIGAGTGLNTNDINSGQKDKYINAIVDGVKASVAVPAGGAAAATPAATDTTTPAATPAAAPSCGSGAGPVVGNRIQTALNLAWTDPAKVEAIRSAIQNVCSITSGGNACGQAIHDAGGKIAKVDATQSFQDVMAQINPTLGDNDQWAFSDCGVFISTVVRSSGTDKDYPPRGTGAQLPYVQAHPEKYDVVPFTDTSQVQPGDWFIKDGHTFFYTGPNTLSPDRNVAEASWGDHVPTLDGTLGVNSVYYRVRPK